jgi:hypothetical protein
MPKISAPSERNSSVRVIEVVMSFVLRLNCLVSAVTDRETLKKSMASIVQARKLHT